MKDGGGGHQAESESETEGVPPEARHQPASSFISPPDGERMRVLHVLARMPGAGTERQLAGMLRAAHQVHWSATLCLLRAGSPLAAALSTEGVPVVELPGGPPWDPERVMAFRHVILAGEFHVVHSSLWGSNLFSRLASLHVADPAIVVSERRVEDHRPRLARLLDMALRPVTDGYIANSVDVAAFVRRSHGVSADRVSVIPNGLDRKTFYPNPRPLVPRRLARIGCIGRLDRQKGFDVMIAALPSVLAVRPVELVIAGSGPEGARLEAAARDNPVHFLGPLSDPSAVADLLRSLDLLVVPSRYEGLPNIVLEARGCGTPLVATDVPGMAEATGGRTGLVPAEDPAALAKAVLAALEREGDTSSPNGIASFDEVAQAHHRAFLAACERRHLRHR